MILQGLFIALAMIAKRILLLGGGLALALFALFSFVQIGLAQDISAGKKKARRCTVCHGPLGIAVVPNAPNLAGESNIYIKIQLRAFRDGSRQHDQMSIIAKRLKDEDIADLAAWFEAIEVTAVAPKLD